MRMSPYFLQLLDSYRVEIDDLRYDSDNKDVLKARLADKRTAFKSLLPMMGEAPEMVAATFHGSIEIRDAKPMERVVLCSPGMLPSWAEVSKHVAASAQMEPLIKLALSEAGGDEFLVVMAAIQFLTQGDGKTAARDADDESDNEDSGDDTGDAGDEDEYDAEDPTKGEEWLKEQGFDRRDE